MGRNRLCRDIRNTLILIQTLEQERLVLRFRKREILIVVLMHYTDASPEAVASTIDATLYAIGLNYEEVRTLLGMLIYSSNIGYTFGKRINRTVVIKKSNIDDEEGRISYLLFAIDNN